MAMILACPMSPPIMSNLPSQRNQRSSLSPRDTLPTSPGDNMPTIPGAQRSSTPQYSPARPSSTTTQPNPLRATQKRKISQHSLVDLKRVKMEPLSSPPSPSPVASGAAAAASTSDNNGLDGMLKIKHEHEPQQYEQQLVQQQYIQQQHIQQQQQEPQDLSAKRQQTLSEYVLACMTKYGLCVLDNFMGPVKASQILNDVKRLDESGVLKTGQTVQKDDEVKNVRKVRQDRIAFIAKATSQGIGDLVNKLDNLLTNVQNKSRLDPRFAGRKFADLSGRTRAMISCYPGNGTHYARHVDNYHKDGRCITVVYYVNKDWDVDAHGGILKVYPMQIHPRVAKIAPQFDRALILWSDQRNPHEVLPAFRSRYAVTVWYFDREERQKALEKAGSSVSSTSDLFNK